jgi:hypothetical protein
MEKWNPEPKGKTKPDKKQNLRSSWNASMVIQFVGPSINKAQSTYPESVTPLILANIITYVCVPHTQNPTEFTNPCQNNHVGKLRGTTVSAVWDRVAERNQHGVRDHAEKGGSKMLIRMIMF